MIQPIILAAGKGTRMQSDLPKVLHEVAGKPMLTHLLDTLRDVEGYLRPIVVVGHKQELIREQYAKRAIFAEQTDIRGTALAVRSALEKISSSARMALVVYGDQPFLRRETLTRLLDHPYYNATLVLGEVNVPNFNSKYRPFEAYGRLVTSEDGVLERIVEYKAATFGEKAIKSLNAGIFCVNAMWLPHALKKVKQDPATGEYYLTALVEIARKEKVKIECILMEPKEALGINSQDDAKAALSYL